MWLWNNKKYCLILENERIMCTYKYSLNIILLFPELMLSSEIISSLNKSKLNLLLIYK